MKNRIKRQRIYFRKLTFRELGPLISLILLMIIFSVLSPVFFTLINLLNIVRQVSLLGIIAIGMSMVIVSGEFDLSVGSLYALGAIVTGLVMTHGVKIWASILIGLSSGLIIGVANGALVAYCRIPSFIVTLGTLNVARGAALLLSKGYVVNLTEKTVIDPNLDKFFFISQGKLFHFVPMLVIFFIIISLIGYIVFNKTLYGFNMKAVGGSNITAKVSGINVVGVKILAFCIADVLSALTGILNLSFMGNVQGSVGSGLELSVISAVIIGGTSLMGGSGTILGTIFGVLIIGVLRNGLVLVGVSPFWQLILIGTIIIAAVGIDISTRKK